MLFSEWQRTKGFQVLKLNRKDYGLQRFDGVEKLLVIDAERINRRLRATRRGVIGGFQQKLPGTYDTHVNGTTWRHAPNHSFRNFPYGPKHHGLRIEEQGLWSIHVNPMSLRTDFVAARRCFLLPNAGGNLASL